MADFSSFLSERFSDTTSSNPFDIDFHNIEMDYSSLITEEIWNAKSLSEFIHQIDNNTWLESSPKKQKVEEISSCKKEETHASVQSASNAKNDILHQAIRIMEAKKERDRERRKIITVTPREKLPICSLPNTSSFPRFSRSPFRITKNVGLPDSNFQYSTSPGYRKMESFPPNQISDWKHAIYNFLVENHNSSDKNTLIMPCILEKDGRLRYGFSLNPQLDPKRRIAELYALHVRKVILSAQEGTSVFIDDLYRHYIRCAFQLMSKYFQKYGAWSYFYEDIPLFVPNETLEEAEERIRLLETKQRKRKKFSI